MREKKSFSELWDDYDKAIRRIQKYIEQNNVYVTPKRRYSNSGGRRYKEPHLDIPFDETPERQLMKLTKPIKETNAINLFNDEN